MNPVLDWRELAPPPEMHSCDCAYCEEVGEWQPVAWPSLIPCAVDGVTHVTDRFLMIKAEEAPIPDGYEGPILKGPDLALDEWRASPVTDQPAEGIPFRWQVIKATEMTGWRLRLLDHPDDASDHTKRAVGVVTATGDHIGWAMSTKDRVDDSRSDRFTRDYTELDGGV